MLRDAKKRGELKDGQTVVDVSSGNTGIALAAIGAALDLNVRVILEPQVSKERRDLIKAYGAELDVYSGVDAEGLLKYQEAVLTDENNFGTRQTFNADNARAHYATTGPEIYRDLDGAVDIFIAASGTGGTGHGAGRYLKELLPDVQVISVEPASAPTLDNPDGQSLDGTSNPSLGAELLEGSFYNTDPFDEILYIDPEDGWNTAQELARVEGLLVGASSGAALYAAEQVAKRPENKGKNIVVVFPDTGERYLSTVFNPDHEFNQD